MTGSSLSVQWKSLRALPLPPFVKSAPSLAHHSGELILCCLLGQRGPRPLLVAAEP